MYIVARVAGNRNPARLSIVLELAMASFSRNQEPPVIFQQP